VALLEGPVLAGTELVRSAQDTLTAGADYAFAPDYTYLRLTVASPDTTHIRYQVLASLDQTVRRFAPLTDIESSPLPVAASIQPVSSGGLDQKLQVAGTKKFSFGVGQNRSGLVEQSLWLSIRGMVGPDLTIEGTISDRSIPTESITRTPSEFDKINLRAYGPGFRSEFGHTELRRDDFQLFNINRRLSGLSASGERGGLRGTGLMGERRGQFRSHRFYGTEGNQGPYSLATGNRVSVVPGSEAVWLDGLRLEQGIERDYIVDYPTGTITFTARRPINREHRITVDYEIASSDYQSLVYQAGSGVTQGGFYTDWLYHREWDDPNRPTSFALSDEDREVLAGAGDSSADAVRSGVDSVGPGNGFYNRDMLDTFFVFAGQGLGEFNISFSYMGPSAGAYRAKGDGSFFYVGDSLGDYSPVVALPLPTETRLFALRAGQKLSGHALEFEYAGSQNDFNKLSNTGDGDNGGSAWLGRYSIGEARSPVEGSLFYRSRSSQFLAPGRDAYVEQDRRWGDSLGSAPGAEQEFGTRFRVGGTGNRAQVAVEGRSTGADDRAWRTAGTVALTTVGALVGQFELLRRSRGTNLEFDYAGVSWHSPLRRLPVALQLKGERRKEVQGYRFAEVGSTLGPAHLNLQAAWRRTDSLTTFWQKSSDLYRLTGEWHKSGPRLDGGLTVHYQRRELATFGSGSEDRVLAESRWIVRRSSWTVRVEHRLSRAAALSQNEEYIPVDEGRGDFREVDGQIIADALGNLIRVVNPSAYGEVARQSEKRANIAYQSSGASLRAEVDLVTSATAADASLPGAQWLLPWYIEAGSPTQRRFVRGELSGGSYAYRWFWRTRWEERTTTYTTRPQQFQKLTSDMTLRTHLSSDMKVEWRAGGGKEAEDVSFPYDMVFALGSMSPAFSLGTHSEIVLPVFGQRYWQQSGDLLADWVRTSIRGVMRVGRKSRLVVEPSLNHVRA
jgi:hypothetical protein